MKITIGKQLVIHFKILIILASLVAMLYGCAATKPNLSIIDKSYIPPRGIKADENFLAVKSILTEISSRNELLAIELGKLPEFQDGVSMEELNGLRNIFRFYNENQSIFDEAFLNMFKIGIPEIRKYCSPLQALFWLAQDGQLNDDNNPLVGYSLEKLLTKAWNFEPNISEKEIKKIIGGIKSEYTREVYSKYLESGEISRLKNIIFRSYKWNPNKFSREVRKTIEQLKEKNPRWGNFNLVVERLNAPELIDYYERRRFIYVDWRTLPHYPVSPQYVFKHNKGACVAITDFTVYCLRKGGYKAQELRVQSYSGLYAFHAVTLFKMNGKKYIMDNGQPMGAGIKSYERFKWEGF